MVVGRRQLQDVGDGFGAVLPRRVGQPGAAAHLRVGGTLKIHEAIEGANRAPSSRRA